MNTRDANVPALQFISGPEHETGLSSSIQGITWKWCGGARHVTASTAFCWLVSIAVSSHRATTSQATTSSTPAHAVSTSLVALLYALKVVNRRVFPLDGMPKAAKPKRKAAEKAKAPRGKGKKTPQRTDLQARALRVHVLLPDTRGSRSRTLMLALTPIGEVGRLLGAKWKELDDEEKKPYVELAAKDKRHEEDERIALRGREEECARERARRRARLTDVLSPP
ncbi:hypothetical protein C8F04DRAFT_1240186 [Mycena alexandri]|uniref:HMG box domain-containing protein n=1 Tax=Mycena alexandri TaxID=1745969 RepID=A0AAD6S912_9AGAR|nr:hypothetical protein C8F04DRAFT_1240186 [Mycena alexandri]